MRPYNEAKHDILWVIDSNISISPQALGRSVDALTSQPKSSRRRIALVHHVPFGTYDEWALGSSVECAFLNTNHAKMYVAINEVAVDSCVVGKSCMYRRSDLERVNGSLRPASSFVDSDNSPRGLPAFSRFLAEDNMIAGALWHELDCRHALGVDVAINAVGKMRLSDYIWRRVRWIRVRKRMVLAATLVEPFQECLMMGGILASSLWYFTGLNPLWSLMAHFGWWIAVDLDVYSSLAGYPVPTAKRMELAGAWLLREFLALPIWMLAMVGNTVEWRGQQYTILRNGEVSVVGKGGYQRAPDA
jgi:ceramide glucosyltransferase